MDNDSNSLPIEEILIGKLMQEVKEQNNKIKQLQIENFHLQRCLDNANNTIEELTISYQLIQQHEK